MAKRACGRGPAYCFHYQESIGNVAPAELVIQPSARNPRAVRAFRKAGFVPVGLPVEAAAVQYQTQPDYRDSVFLARRLPASKYAQTASGSVILAWGA